ncbi:hypothetical protein KFK09_016829 [Dendrobium nobile]|uniref:DNA-directed RNA polymerase III subunit RPC4 n=1 Tax=Dendrobium nobile TaxID=94219 RepID=A0A8T3B0R8_DENNO|nr:hypothetical protein KFK09_016829 [Dendrobium nobile]
MKDGSDSGSGPPPIKLKFAPKIPVRKSPKPAVVKTDLSARTDDIVDRELLAKLSGAKSQDNGRRFKSDKKAVQDEVTFGYGNSSTQASSFVTPTAGTQSEDDPGLVSQPREYVEPWDYARSHYPTTLPLRRPYSGDPEVLDRLEFGEGGSAHLPIDEDKINAAQKLGLMETSDEPKMIFLQLPFDLPSAKPPDEEKGPGNKAADESSTACKLKDPPGGFMGKLLVYRSGKVTMKMGEVLFDVSPGIDTTFVEELVAVNAKERHYCVLGELNKHAVVTPDIDALLDDSDSDA